MFKPVIALVMTAVSLPAHAKETPTEILRMLPTEIGGFESGTVRTYDKPMLGASLGYDYQDDDGEVCATLYVWDMGIAQIPDGIDSDQIRTAYRYAKIDIDYYERKGYYSDVVLLEEGIHETGTTGNAAALSLRAKYRYTRNISDDSGCGNDVTSYIYLFGARDHFIKVRATVSVQQAGAEGRIEKFVDDIAGRLLHAGVVP